MMADGATMEPVFGDIRENSQIWSKVCICYAMVPYIWNLAVQPNWVSRKDGNLEPP